MRLANIRSFDRPIVDLLALRSVQRRSLLSHKHKFIYIHIPKTAGTSIETAFGHHQPGRINQDHRTVREIEPIGHVLRNGCGLNSLEILAKRSRNQIRRLTGGYFDLPSSDQFESYLKFAIVRNPWERCHSWYKNVMRNEWLRLPLGIAEDCSFDRFMRDYPSQWGLRPQTYWLQNSAGEIELDYIGRFEQLNEAFAEVCKRLNIAPVELPKMLVKHGRADFRADYDDSLIEYVQNLYAREIDYFDYKFQANE